MIGILLALQVNNWNETLKVKAKEVKYLKELNSDLKSNQSEILNLSNRIEQRIYAIDSIFYYLEKSDEISVDLLKHIAISQGTNIFNNSNTSFEFLKAQGIDFISNDSLRIRISEIYEYDFKNIH